MPSGSHPPDDGKSVATFRVPPPPAYLSKFAKQAWHQLAGEITNLGLLRSVDTTAFAAACEASATLRMAQDVIRKSGLTYKAKGGLIKTRPEVKIASDAMRHLARFLSEFGLTPAARARVAHVTPLSPGNQPRLPIDPPAPAPHAPTAGAAAAAQHPATLPDESFFRGPGAGH